MLFSTLVSYGRVCFSYGTGGSERQRKTRPSDPGDGGFAAAGLLQICELHARWRSRIFLPLWPAIADKHLNIVLPIGISFYTFHTISVRDR